MESIRRGLIWFFVTEQTCLEQKKYAGTRESKAATAKALAEIGGYILNQCPGFDRDVIPFTGTLGDDMFRLHVLQQREISQSIVAEGQKIVDQDTGQCVRQGGLYLPG